MFHGIPELEKDSQGFIYWKGVEVEHYSHDDEIAQRIETYELASRCLRLERKGIPVKSSTVIHRWNWFRDIDMLLHHKLQSFLVNVGDIYESKDNPNIIAFEYGDDVYIADGMIICTLMLKCNIDRAWEERGAVLYHIMRDMGYQTARMGQLSYQGINYASLEQVINYLAARGITSNPMENK